MNKFTKKGRAYKIIISLLIVITLFNVISPTVSHAASLYGTLFDPIRAFLLGLGDAIMGLVNKIDNSTGVTPAVFTIEPGKWLNNLVIPFMSVGGATPIQRGFSLAR